jgi:NAD(P)-dependent dehydrogenase (short-subunit alcohol dehydrogenase family)
MPTDQPRSTERPPGSQAQHPTQTLAYPGHESQMQEPPADSMADYVGQDLLDGRIAVVTGGDSGIGRAVAVAYAKEGADVVVSYLSEHDDAARTQELVRAAGRRCLTVAGDLAGHAHRADLVAAALAEFGRIDVLVNNAAFQSPVDSVLDLTLDQWRHTFGVNVEAAFFLVQAALPSMRDGSCIINTASVTGLRGHATLLDYAASKGAMLALTYSLAQALVDRRIRVNAVAPGPVWTPLIPATLGREKAEEFGAQVPFDRAAEPDEIAPSFVFLASDRMSSYYTGQVLSPLGGQVLGA